MTSAQLEKRVAVLEAELTKLKSKIEGPDASGSRGGNRLPGRFRTIPIYQKAMKLGQQYRRSQQPEQRIPQRNRTAPCSFSIRTT